MKANVTPKAQIVSTGIYLPEERLKSEHLMEYIKSEKQYGIPRTYLTEDIGIVERRVSPHGTKPSDLAIRAAEQAIFENDQVNIDSIGAVIFCGIERDQPEPATAHTIQNALGLKANYVFDVSNACFGFLDGIQIASSYIKACLVEQALVVTGEVSSKLLYQFTDQLARGMSKADALKKIGALTVGDAAGAIVIGRSFGYDCPGFELFNNNVDSAHVEKCIYRVREDGRMEGNMEMGKMVAVGLRMQQAIIQDTLKRIGWSTFDWLLTHQIGNRFFERLSLMSGVSSAKMIKTFDKLGNITTATFPVSYHMLINSGKVLSGDRIGGCFAGSGLVAGQFGYRV